MDNNLDRIIKSLQKPQDARNEEDIRLIHSHFSQQLWFHELHNDEIEDLCLRGRYESHNIGSVIYRKGDVAKSWYVLISGNVIIGTLLFSSPCCFGQKAQKLRRVDDCLVLDPSEVVVVDYNSSQSTLLEEPTLKPQFINKSYSFSGDRCHSGENFVCLPHITDESLPVKKSFENSRDKCMMEREELSTEIDTESVFSARGSDTMTSSAGDHGIDLTGLLESTVDSDNDDSDEEISSQIKTKLVSDDVLEALEKEEKTERDIKLILDLVQHLPAFNNMTSNLRKDLCSVMRYAQIEEENKILISNGAQLDTWVVILNGLVEIEEANEVKVLQTGDCFGVKPSQDKQLNAQCIKTKTEKCQFLLVPQEDYCRILNEGAANIRKVYEDGEVVLVFEKRKIGNKDVEVIIRGQANHLLQQLFQQTHDSTYIHDFLLTYRTFFKYPAQVAYKIVEYLEFPLYKEKVVSIFLDWMNWHYRDFENHLEMRIFLEHLEKRLEDLGMLNELELLTSTCARLSKTRMIVLNKKSRDESLQFELIGENNKASAVFVNFVEEGSKAHEAGLGRGDQVLDVNTKSFRNITLQEANAVLSYATHLSITVKYNMHEYKQLRKKSVKKSVEVRHNSYGGKNVNQCPVTGMSLPFNLEDPRKPPVLGKIRNKLMKVFPRNAFGQIPSASDLFENGRCQTLGVGKKFGSSHPDLSSLHLLQKNNIASDFVAMNDLNVLKIFREDQTYRYVFVDKEITAQQVVMLALKEFGLVQTSRNFSLYEVTLSSDNCIKQKRLPGNLQNLAEKSTFNSRYYIKHIEGCNTLLPDDCLEDLKKECQLNFLSLNCAEIAAQLTYKDFDLFSRISPSEYIEELFQLNNSLKSSSLIIDSSLSNLKRFERLANTEMFWVVTHICNEQNLSNRVKAIKNFIHIAKHCIECKNFNSAFAIISGLGHQSVSRLKQTWEKLPSKSQKLFEDLQALMDPTRNMCKYRSIINSERPPLIPFYPLVIKDLTFIHLGNDSLVDGLINFEKLCMIAKEVRHISNMAPCPNAIDYSSLNSSAMAMMRRKIDDLSILNRKKMYEEAQMVRKVRAYLASYKLVEDENQLAEMSNCCEPLDGTTKRFDFQLGNSKLIHSGYSGPKFGTDSPENIKKLVSLSAGSRPFEGSTEELKPSTFDEKVTLHARQGITQPVTNLLSNSQFYIPINSSSQPSLSKQKRRNLSKETDSGRFSCSGDDGSIRSLNSSHSSPLSNSPYKKEIPISGNLSYSKEISNLFPSNKSNSEDFTLRPSHGVSIPHHLADNSRKKYQIKKVAIGHLINTKHDYI